MSDPPETHSDRLDSWKAIAEHLQREVRTVRRWEKQGLPIRRVPGGRKRTVFAYVSEIDGWLKASATVADNQPISNDSPLATAPAKSRWQILQWGLTPGSGLGVRPLLVGAALVIGVVAIGWHSLAPAADTGALTYQVTSTAIVATSADGHERWRYSFSPGVDAYAIESRSGPLAQPLSAGRGIIVGVDTRSLVKGETGLAGQLLWLSGEGRLEKAFSFSQDVAFGASHYVGPWTMTDYRVYERNGIRRVAVAAHHHEWWPSLVTVLDDNWQPHGLFVNAGWIERLQWIAADRLIIAGFSNTRDGGMVALLDPSSLDGQSPPKHDDTYTCTSCGQATPLRYIVFPRSEVNIASVSPFNRVRLDVSDTRIVARTIETPDELAPAADILYEFTPSLEFVQASYSDRYWEIHRLLESQGKIHHARDACPDRDGPRPFEVWTRSTGWRTVAARSRP